MTATSSLPGALAAPGARGGNADPDADLWAWASGRATRALPLPIGTTNQKLYTGRGILLGWSVVDGGGSQAGKWELLDGWDTSGSILAEIVVPALVYALTPSDTQVDVSSTGGAAANNLTIPGVAAQTTFITGFEITGLGATAASTIAITVTGILGGTKTYYLTIPAGVTTALTPLIVEYTTPIPASAVNTAIVVNVPSFGAGNTTAGATAHGFQRSIAASAAGIQGAVTTSLPGNGVLFRNGLYLRTINDTLSGALYVRI